MFLITALSRQRRADVSLKLAYSTQRDLVSKKKKANLNSGGGLLAVAIYVMGVGVINRLSLLAPRMRVSLM